MGRSSAGPRLEAGYHQARNNAIAQGMTKQMKADIEAMNEANRQHRAKTAEVETLLLEILREEKIDMEALDVLFQEPQEEEGEETAEDDVKGGPLDPKVVRTARQSELRYLWDRAVYRHATRAEMASVGRRAIRLK